mmetsp:Transcript_116645/g.336907  ORF Transcript_116645/g.336907 Transcript_116645/m.336907 type:complete len:276 (-) Transcript_116645:620-1447(-)
MLARCCAPALGGCGRCLALRAAGPGSGQLHDRLRGRHLRRRGGVAHPDPSALLHDILRWHLRVHGTHGAVRTCARRGTLRRLQETAHGVLSRRGQNLVRGDRRAALRTQRAGPQWRIHRPKPACCRHRRGRIGSCVVRGDGALQAHTLRPLGCGEGRSALAGQSVDGDGFLRRHLVPLARGDRPADCDPCRARRCCEACILLEFRRFRRHSLRRHNCSGMASCHRRVCAGPERAREGVELGVLLDGRVKIADRLYGWYGSNLACRRWRMHFDVAC